MSYDMEEAHDAVRYDLIREVSRLESIFATGYPTRYDRAQIACYPLADERYNNTGTNTKEGFHLGNCPQPSFHNFRRRERHCRRRRKEVVLFSYLDGSAPLDERLEKITAAKSRN